MNIALIHSGVAGTEQAYGGDGETRYRIERISGNWQPDFVDDDVVLVPNGANHVALYEARAAVHALLARGGCVLCFCGFFTPWLPGNRWRHDHSHPLAQIRYRVQHDALGLFEGVDPEELAVDAHGIRGGWACGAIETAQPENIVLTDQYGRAVLVADRHSTRGLIIASASAPLADHAPAEAASGARRLYRNILGACRTQQEHYRGG